MTGHTLALADEQPKPPDFARLQHPEVCRVTGRDAIDIAIAAVAMKQRFDLSGLLNPGKLKSGVAP